MRSSAIAQVQIDQALIGNADLFGHRLEIVDAFFIEADGDLLLELRSVGVLNGFRKVVFGSHDVTFRKQRPRGGLPAVPK